MSSLSTRNCTVRGKEVLPEAIKGLLVALYLLVAQMVGESNSSVGIVSSMIVAGTATLMLSRFEAISFMFTLIASNRLLTFGPISVLSVVTIAYLFKNIILEKNAGCIGKGVIATSAGLLFYSCVQACLDASLSPIADSAKVILVVLCLSDIYSRLNNRNAFYQFNEAFSFGIIIAAAFGILFDPDLLQESGRLTVGSDNGQNVLGITCSFSIMVLLSKMIFDRSDPFDPFLSLALAAIGVMTGSRSFILSLLIGVLFICLCLIVKASFRFVIKMAIIIIITCVILWILIANIPHVSTYVNTLVERIVNPRNGDISNERFDIWAQYCETFSSNYQFLLFGSSNLLQYGIDIVAHNFLLEQIASFGVIGSIIIILLYIISIRGVFNTVSLRYPSKVSPMLLSPIISLLAASCFSHTLLGIPQTMMLYFGICFTFVRRDQDGLMKQR